MSGKKCGHPIRFILNNSSATVANVYLAMYPKPLLAKAIEQAPTILRHAWEMLNRITPEQLVGEGRVYGGGLLKLEPGELANVDASEIAVLIPDFKQILTGEQLDFFGG